MGLAVICAHRKLISNYKLNEPEWISQESHIKTIMCSCKSTPSPPCGKHTKMMSLVNKWEIIMLDGSGENHTPEISLWLGFRQENSFAMLFIERKWLDQMQIYHWGAFVSCRWGGRIYNIIITDLTVRVFQLVTDSGLFDFTTYCECFWTKTSA